MLNYFEKQNFTKNVHFQKYKENKVLFGDNYSHIRFINMNGVSSAGGGGDMGGAMSVHSFTGQRQRSSQYDPTSEEHRRAEQQRINRQEQTVTDTTTTTIRSFSELEGLIGNGSAGRAIDIRTSRMSPEVYQALARGEQVQVRLQQTAPERVNMFIPLIASVMQIFGGMGGAAYNRELTNAINPELHKAAEFVRRHGTNYDMSLFGGAQHIDVQAEFSVLPSNESERPNENHEVNIPIVPQFTRPPRSGDIRDISPGDAFRGRFTRGDERFFTADSFRELNDIFAEQDYRDAIEDRLATLRGFLPDNFRDAGFRSKSDLESFIVQSQLFLDATERSGGSSPLETLQQSVFGENTEIRGSHGNRIRNMEEFFEAARAGQLTSEQRQAYNTFVGVLIDKPANEVTRDNDPLRGGNVPGSLLGGENPPDRVRVSLDHLLLTRNDIGHLFYTQGISEGSNGVLFSNAYSSGNSQLPNTFTQTMLNNHTVSVPEHDRAMLIVAYGDRLGGSHATAESLMRMSDSDFESEMKRRIGSEVDSLFTQDGQLNHSSVLERLQQRAGEGLRASFIEAGPSRNMNMSSLSSEQLQFMAMELVLRHKNGPDGRPIAEVMDGLIGPQHMTAMQESFIDRAESLVDVAQILNGQAPLSLPITDTQWSQIARELGMEVSQVRALIQREGSIDDLTHVRLDDVLQSLYKTFDGNSDKTSALDRFKSQASASQMSGMTLSQLTDSQKEALLDSVPEGIRSQVRELLSQNPNMSLQEFIGNELIQGNKQAIMEGVSSQLGTLRTAITGSGTGSPINLMVHPELFQLTREIGHVQGDISMSLDSMSASSEGGVTNQESAQEFQRQMMETADRLLQIIDSGGTTVNGRPIADVIREMEQNYEQFLLQGFEVPDGGVQTLADKFSSMHTKVQGLGGFDEVRDGFALALEANNKVEEAERILSGNREGRTTVNNNTELIGRLINTLPQDSAVAEQMRTLNNQEDPITREQLSSLLTSMGSLGENMTKEFLAIAERLMRKARENEGESSTIPTPDLTQIYESYRSLGESHREALSMTISRGQSALRGESTPPVTPRPVDGGTSPRPVDNGGATPVVTPRPVDNGGSTPVVNPRPRDPVPEPIEPIRPDPLPVEPISIPTIPSLTIPDHLLRGEITFSIREDDMYDTNAIEREARRQITSRLVSQGYNPLSYTINIGAGQTNSDGTMTVSYRLDRSMITRNFHVPGDIGGVPTHGQSFDAYAGYA